MDFPIELLFLIVFFLGRNDRINFALASKKLMSIVCSLPGFERKIIEVTEDTVITPLMIVSNILVIRSKNVLNDFVEEWGEYLHLSSIKIDGYEITDVSMLGNVHTLNLCGTKVTDVSMLGNVHTLNLRYTQVTDVSMLGNVHIIN